MQQSLARISSGKKPASPDQGGPSQPQAGPSGEIPLPSPPHSPVFRYGIFKGGMREKDFESKEAMFKWFMEVKKKADPRNWIGDHIDDKVVRYGYTIETLRR
jgi:hypothetical protein